MNDENALYARIARLETACAFFASCIKSGEPWSDTCEQMRAEAIGATDAPKCALHANDAADALRWRGVPCSICGATSTDAARHPRPEGADHA